MYFYRKPSGRVTPVVGIRSVVIIEHMRSLNSLPDGHSPFARSIERIPIVGITMLIDYLIVLNYYWQQWILTSVLIIRLIARYGDSIIRLSDCYFRTAPVRACLKSTLPLRAS